MGSILTSEIIDEASTILFDKTQVRWPSADLISYLNAGQFQIVCLKPEAGIKNESVLGVAGETKQTLPAGGIQFMRLTRNMGTDGLSPSKAIKPADMDMMDAENEDWHTDAATDNVLHFMFRESDPLTYYVWPKLTASRYYEIVYSSAPDEVAATTDPITIADIYRNALVNWILYTAYRKNNAIAGNPGRALEAEVAFYKTLGMKDRAEDKLNPNLTSSMAKGVNIQ